MVNKRKAFVYQFSYQTKQKKIKQTTANRKKIIMYCQCLTLKRGIDELAFNIEPKEGGFGYFIILWIPAYDTPSRVARDVNRFYKKVFGNGSMDFPLSEEEYYELADEADELPKETFYLF